MSWLKFTGGFVQKHVLLRKKGNFAKIAGRNKLKFCLQLVLLKIFGSLPKRQQDHAILSATSIPSAKIQRKMSIGIRHFEEIKTQNRPNRLTRPFFN